MDLAKELSENQTVLLLVPSIDYNETLVEVMKHLAGKSICYVTLNRTFDSLKEFFQKNKIDLKNVVFIDAISKTMKKVSDQMDQCYFVHSPGALTELSLTISKFLKHDFEHIILDSLSNLLIYRKKEPVEKFIMSLNNEIKSTKAKAVFYALKIREHEELIKQCSICVDKVIDLDGEKD